MVIGIISYLPDNPELRSNRLDKHKRQLELFKTLNVPIFIVAQNYKQEELSNIPNINYYVTEKQYYEEGRTLVKNFKQEYHCLKLGNAFLKGQLRFDDIYTREIGYDLLKELKVQ